MSPHPKATTQGEGLTPQQKQQQVTFKVLEEKTVNQNPISRKTFKKQNAFRDKQKLRKLNVS